jgi:hypothetical protein
MKRGIQGVTRREQPKLPITMSVAWYTLLESLRDSQKYNLYFRAISWELNRNRNKGRFIFSVVIVKHPVWPERILAILLLMNPGSDRIGKRGKPPARKRHSHGCCEGLRCKQNKTLSER